MRSTVADSQFEVMRGRREWEVQTTSRVQPVGLVVHGPDTPRKYNVVHDE